MHPYAFQSTPELLPWADALIDTLSRGMAAWVDNLEATGTLDLYPSPVARRERLLAADTDALIAAQLALIADPGITDRLHRLTMPCLMMVGSGDPYNDSARQAAKDLANADFVAMSGFGHTMVHAQTILPYVRAFHERFGMITDT